MAVFCFLRAGRGVACAAIAALAGMSATLSVTALPLLAPAPAHAQLGDAGIEQGLPVALVADSIEYDSNTGIVTAAGNVEVYYGERTLTADRIIYNSRTERIAAEGNIVLRDPEGSTVFADVADLDVDLVDGLIQGARSVIGRSGLAKLTAVEARRVGDRYNALSKAVYSPCEVCEESPTPLWRIRARRVIHDEEARIIHYEDAYFDVFGVPVLYLPYFSNPDPTVERATGFLIPSPGSGNFGLGLRVPFYVVIDDQSDVTFQPLFTTEDGSFMDVVYRRAFTSGGLTFRGSAGPSGFTGSGRKFEGHIDTQGLFSLNDLDRGAQWGWDIKFASDDAYLRFFDISNEDRLVSELFVRNYWQDGFYEVAGVYFQSLRDNEPAGDIPRVIPDVALRREFQLPRIGGELGLFADTQTLLRNEGTDTTRISLGADWEREWITPQGLALRGFGELRGDLFLTFSDAGSGKDDTALRLAPLAGVEARYPLIWDEESGSSHIVEPIVQFIAAPYGGNGDDIPNEDSQQTEFDELNLFDTSHFSGLDGFEEGPRFNLGLRYERLSADGLSFDATIGRSVRFADSDEFLEGTGLSGELSDWVASWSTGYRGYVNVRHRLRFGGDGDISRNEVFGNVNLGPASLSGGYVFLEESPFVSASSDREEVTALAALQVTPEWRVASYMQRDLAEDEFVEIGGQVSFNNECCAIDLFIRRRFTESEDTPANTSFGLQLRLLTLGTPNQRQGLFAPSTFADFGDSLSRPSRGTDFESRALIGADR
ncbi:MAG: LPS assembly protein LptD [Pseudomonadota bacterium]